MMSEEEVFNERKNKFLRIGRNKGFMSNMEDLSSLKISKSNLDTIFKSKKFLISIVGFISVILILFFIYL